MLTITSHADTVSEALGNAIAAAVVMVGYGVASLLFMVALLAPFVAGYLIVREVLKWL